MKHIRVIGLDADDTLWHNESIFEKVHGRYRTLLARYHDSDTVDKTLLATEQRNLDLYGYGIKGFTLSAIETAIELTEGRISAEEISTLIGLGREMLDHPVELLDGVSETVAALASSHQLGLITKGDLRDQQRKLSKSGLARHFQFIEIVSEKDASTYAEILDRRQIAPAEFLMIGNSMKSDILPVLEIGASALHIPYHLSWVLDRTEHVPSALDRFFSARNFRELPSYLKGGGEKLRVEG
jgi:putative hydrolase of the HAD superfamily